MNFAELFRDGVPRNWRHVLTVAGIDHLNMSRQDLWDAMNPTEKFCTCGKERPVKKTNTGRLDTCGEPACRDALKSAKTRATSLAKYGTLHPMQAAVIKEKQAATFATRYSGHPTKTSSVQAKRRSTNLARYGIAVPALEESRRAASVKKRAETEYNKYITGVWPGRVQYFKEHLGIDVLSDFKSVKDELTCRHNTCGTVWTAVPTPTPRCPTCSISREQQSLDSFIDSLGVHYLRNTRKIIPPYEIDLYIPTLRVGIELNGMYWHRENNGTPIALKTELAAKIGVRLMHVSDKEWNEHRDIVQSHILHMLNRTPNMASARKCVVKSIDASTSRKFLLQTHLQGAANARHHIGLYHQDTLVAVMTLGSPRWGEKTGLELIRWSTALNTTVRGGFTKVLSFVKREFNPPRILSYCDLRTGTGGVYKAAGFTYKGDTKPGYVWIRGRDILQRHATQKHLLRDVLGEKFNPVLTERENMESSGWMRVFDAGHQRWVLES